ncbi:MAG: DNA replication and repair protein RecF [Paraglaciecola sp.]|jgi:DNA replication and repair protein RecF
MKLDLVQIRNLRNLEDVAFQPSHSINVFVGENGSGKSSILEAIHYLGFARSFRSNKHKNVIQHQKQNFTVFCEAHAERGRLKLGLSRSTDDSFSVSVDGEHSKKVAALVSELPVQVFTPQSSDLLLGPPKLRRRYLDWLLFHVEHSFYEKANSYQKVIKHKNALLRRGMRKSCQQSEFWNMQFIQLGLQLTQYRGHILETELKPLILSNLRHFLPEFSFEISYYRGWEKDLSLEESLLKHSERDQRVGYTSIGPHKADMRIKLDGVLAHEVLSRGQLRMLVAALQLAQTQHLHSYTKKTSIFLLDDIGAELDVVKRELFIDKLLDLNAQLFVTAIEKQQIAFINKYHDKKMFHVEHGQVREEN